MSLGGAAASLVIRFYSEYYCCILLCDRTRFDDMCCILRLYCCCLLVNTAHTYSIPTLLLYCCCCCCSAHRGCAVAFEIPWRCDFVRMVALPLRSIDPINCTFLEMMYVFVPTSDVGRQESRPPHAHTPKVRCLWQ